MTVNLISLQARSSFYYIPERGLCGNQTYRW